MFDADRPIKKAIDDRLNRTIFSKYLARCILDHHDVNSTVLGLFGGWGCGKTSIINLVLEELEFAATNIEDNEKPIILNFSPWSYSGQEQLIYSFFRRLSSAFRKVTYLEEGDHIIHLLELYISFFTHKPVPKPLRQYRSPVDKITFSNKEDVYGWESGRDLTDVKAELNRLLAEEHHKIIIIMDNISRLYDKEVKQIFQIIKSIGDFSNTVYLLSFDKQQIINALDRLNGQGGEEFVEKVVQLPFEIPYIDVQSLEPLLIDRLNHMIHEVPPESWQKEYWADIYYSSFRHFFKNIRDITRYINTLHFSYLRLRDVVNPVDFFALTAINVFIPDIYSAICDNKDLFTDLIDNVYIDNKTFIEKDKLRFESILLRNNRISKDALKEMLMILFPRLKKLYGIDNESYSLNARKLKRVCDSDAFDAYFRLSIQEGNVSDIEFKAILNLASTPDMFDQALARLNKDERIEMFLCQLDAIALDTINPSSIENIIASFFDNADLFPKGTNSELSFDTFSRLHRIVRRICLKLPQEQRFDIIKNAISKMKNSILFAIYEIRELLKEQVNSEKMPLLSLDQLTILQKVAADKITEWSKSGRLEEHPERLSIMYAFSEWGDNKRCERYIETLVAHDQGLVSFLQAALEKPILDAMTEYHKNPDWEKSLNHITHFIPIETISDRAIGIFEDAYFEKLREEEQLAIIIFLDLIHANTIKVIPKTTA